MDTATGQIQRKVTVAMNTMLLRRPSAEEIRGALFQIHPTKSPRYDGLHAIFFQKFWDIVGHDIVQFILRWWDGSASISGINHTIISLIPKTSNPTKISEYRPISLCTVLYKIISKLITLRLRPVMQSVISYSQTAFTKGRLISDNALIALEGFHSMRTDLTGEGSFALKLDMTKAYDRIEWNFLEKVLVRLGFATSWISKIMQCVQTPTFSFKINGSIVNHVVPTRGLRQGDPLSPYLFIMCAEVLSSLLQARANPEECAQVTDTLSLYERASGQKINYAKTNVSYSRNVICSDRDSLTHQLGVSEVNSHIKYLGFPTEIGRSRVQAFGFLKDKISKKLNNWNGDKISKAGKEILINSVLQSVSSYVMGVYHIPVSLVDEIHGMIARFWWGSVGLRQTVHWKSWSSLCLPKNLGGLGFRDLKAFNIALLGKQGQSLMVNQESLVSRILKAKYFASSDFVEAELKSGSSYSWSSIMHCKDLLKKGMYWRIGDGQKAKIHSNWIPDGTTYKQGQPLVHLPANSMISSLINAVQHVG